MAPEEEAGIHRNVAQTLNVCAQSHHDPCKSSYFSPGQSGGRTDTKHATNIARNDLLKIGSTVSLPRGLLNEKF